jgi:hypothetical protein
VPKGAGKELSAGRSGPGGTILEPAVRGAQQSGTGDQQGGDSDQQEGDSPDSAALGTPASSSGDSGASALLDPVVLLVIAGVIAATVGMTLRRRQTTLDRAATGDAPRTQPSERPTPDGGIDGDEGDEP